MAGAGRGVPRAFTIIEVLVAVAIVAVLAGVMVPRLGNVGRRQVDNDARAVLALVSSVGQRDAMSSQAYAISYDPEARIVGLLTLVEGAAEADGRIGAPQWVVAPGQSPVVLGAAEIRSIALDGQVLSGAWTVELRPAQPRPSISVLVCSRDDPDGPAWQIELDPGALTGGVVGLESPGAWSPAAANAVDLDVSSGRGTPW
ncbi:MAG: prepilin-type N-terminal cleavage/methylation domain-containing protein [Phycisphaerales bacterium]